MNNGDSVHLYGNLYVVLQRPAAIECRAIGEEKTSHSN